LWASWKLLSSEVLAFSSYFGSAVSSTLNYLNRLSFSSSSAKYIRSSTMAGNCFDSLILFSVSIDIELSFF